jgi:hypothetical protein
MKQTLTIIDKLLLAAHEIENKGRIPFSAEDLVVKAWKLFPDAFGLAGYNDNDGKPKHPDSNRVYVEIMGSKPIRKRGLLTKVGRKMYKLTEAGKRRATLLTVGSKSSPQKATFSRDIETEVRRLMDSRAATKIRSNRKNDLTFHDACAFWGISPRSNAKDLWSRFEHTQSVIKDAIEATRGKTSITMEHGGIPFTEGDMQALKSVHEELINKFNSELTYIRKRTDERKF